jgi:hypothetical protein
MKTTTIKTLIATIACLTILPATYAFAADGTSYPEAVSSYLQQIVSPAETGNLTGNSAIIKISYNKNGQFDQAAVSGAGDVTLARKIHNNVNWKSFPANGKAETTIVVAVNTSGNIDVTVR